LSPYAPSADPDAWKFEDQAATLVRDALSREATDGVTVNEIVVCGIPAGTLLKYGKDADVLHVRKHGFGRPGLRHGAHGAEHRMGRRSRPEPTSGRRPTPRRFLL
jgi:hypothetical protein